MNWRLLLILSLCALFLGPATVYFIPSGIESVCWLAVFIVSAWAIARDRRQGRFAHGVVLGLINSVWVTGSHVLLFNAYVARHAAEMQTMSAYPGHLAPRTLMAVTGPVIGLLSGVIIGLVTLLVGLFVKPAAKANAAAA